MFFNGYIQYFFNVYIQYHSVCLQHHFANITYPLLYSGYHKEKTEKRKEQIKASIISSPSALSPARARGALRIPCLWGFGHLTRRSIAGPCAYVTLYFSGVLVRAPWGDVQTGANPVDTPKCGPRLASRP